MESQTYPAHHVHSSGGHFAGQWAAAAAAAGAADVLALAPNCALPGLTLSFYTWPTDQPIVQTPWASNNVIEMDRI